MRQRRIRLGCADGAAELSAISDATQLGTKYAKTRRQMPLSWSRAFAAVGLALSIAASLGDPTLLAQATPTLPAVSVLRNSGLWNQLWPADFNGDGITDLAASSHDDTFPPSFRVEIALGHGDGTFASPVASPFVGTVLAVADVDGDGRIDVLAVSPDTHPVVVVLPGNGDGTLGAARTIAQVDDVTFVSTADFDGDGVRDVAIGSESAGLQIFPGRGGFAFGGPVTLSPGPEPSDAIVTDLNGDGRKDIVVASRFGNELSVFLNRGQLTFTASTIPLDSSVTDVTAADVNGDGRIDLLASGANPQDSGFFTEGYAYVIAGNGDGTFQAPVRYDVAPGAFQIVVGDFTRDGILDIATANRSAVFIDDICGNPYKTWDSISILPGRGDGTFEAASSFSIGDQNAVADDDYRETVTKLNTSDLNGDHATDLILSDGVVFLNERSAANRAPSVDAGPDAVLLNTRDVTLAANVVEPDDDVVTYAWTSSDGETLPPIPNPCVTGLADGPHTFTVTVDDGHGHRASASVTYTVAESTGGGPLPTSDDVGAVSPAGSDTFDGATYTLTGSGADIWGTTDAFHYVWTQMGGNFAITTRVGSVQDVDAWTKAGVMIRESLDPGARHASLFATPGKGLAFQRREHENGVSIHTPGPMLAAPVWLRLSRQDDVISAYYRVATTDVWTKLGDETLAGLVDQPLVGLAVTSHDAGVPATATFSGVTIAGAPVLSGAAVGSGTGNILSWDGTVMTVDATGTDIWGTDDAFFFANTAWEGDGTVTAHVRSIANTSAWSKAGVMFRETLDADSKHVMLVVSPGRGIALQYRSATAGTSQSVQVAGAAPEWLRLARIGDNFTASISHDGQHWTTVGTVTIAMDTNILAGLPVTSHDSAAATDAAFEDISITP